MAAKRNLQNYLRRPGLVNRPGPLPASAGAIPPAGTNACLTTGYPARPVLITLMLRWRVGTQPCDTALDWEGCPLPSLKVPPRK